MNIAKWFNSPKATTAAIPRTERYANLNGLSAQVIYEKEHPPAELWPSLHAIDESTHDEVDGYKPRRDRRMERLLGKIESDDDVWVEREYVDKKGKRSSYFRSFRTRRCVLYEPPTGAGTLVLLNEIEKYPCLYEFATEPLDRPLSEIERPHKKKRHSKNKKRTARRKEANAKRS